MAAFALNRDQAVQILAKSGWVKAWLSWVMAALPLGLNALELQQHARVTAAQAVIGVVPLLWLVLTVAMRRHARHVLGGAQ